MKEQIQADPIYTKTICNPVYGVDPVILEFDHPALVKIYDIKELKTDRETQILLSMENVKGRDLSEYLKRRKRVSFGPAVRFLLELCDALDYLHHYGCGYLYLDLKPSNIMVTEDGHIILIDLDTCMTAAEANRLKKTGALPGTKGYAAPEQYSGDYPIDSRSDIYSLGITFFVLMTGKNPFDVTDGDFDLCRFRPFADRRLSEIISKCTRVNPDGRYKDIRELKYEITGLI